MPETAPERTAATDLSAESDQAVDRRFGVFSVIVLVTGVVAAALMSWWLPLNPSTDLIATGLLLVLAFLVVEQLSVNIDVRGGISWTISFTEIPLAIGLFVAPFQVVLAAHLIAGVGTLLARRVQDRVLYNTGAEILEITSAFAVYTVVNSLLLEAGPRWIGAFAGALAAPVTSTLLGLAAVYVLGRRLRVAAATKLVFRILVLGHGQRLGRRRLLQGRRERRAGLAARARHARRRRGPLPRVLRPAARTARPGGAVRDQPDRRAVGPARGRSSGQRPGHPERHQDRRLARASRSGSRTSSAPRGSCCGCGSTRRHRCSPSSRATTCPTRWST